VKELEDIVRAYDRLTEDRSPFALATVVGVSGSTYRRPGARMLFSSAGRTAGLINAACFEADLAEQAQEVIRTGKARLITYDSTSPNDILFGLGLGCNGIVEVLLEPGADPATGQKIEVFRSVENGEPTMLATVVKVKGREGLRAGDFLASNKMGIVASTIPNSNLSSRIVAEGSVIADASSARRTYSRGIEEIDVFFQRVLPPVPLLVFGAGADAAPLVDAAKQLGWHVTVIDQRPAYANKSRFPGADSVVVSDQLPDGLKVSDRHVAVIMTHNFDRDRIILPILLGSPARYVGLLGPGSKLRALLEDLEGHGFSPGMDQLDRLYAPIGLDIGAETPEEIALSIVAEIKSVLEGRTGGSLRDRPGPIHGALPERKPSRFSVAADS
jgi:xanthine dehydrogenase accessory factor